MTGKAGKGGAPKILDAQGFADAAGVSHETAQRFEIWRALIETWNARINLVGPSTLSGFWTRHALDCAQIVDLVPKTENDRRPLRWVDIGSGAGFPGLAVALVLEGRGRDDEVHLVESSQKKAAFLREAVRAVKSRAIVRPRRIEEVAVEEQARGAAGGFDVITARACAPLGELLGLAAPLWRETGLGVFLKGREAEVELTAAAKSWRFRFVLQPSRSDSAGRVVLIERPEHVPSS